MPIVAAFATLACHEPEPDPPDEQSEYVDLYLDDGIEVCAGQLAAYDRYVEQVFERYAGEDPPPDFRMRLNALADEQRVLEICGSSWRGCAGHGEAWISSGTGSPGYHELTHLIIGELDGNSAPSLAEGIADGFSSGTGGALISDKSMDFLFAASSDDLNYSVAALFFRFVSERHGMPAFREYYRAMKTDRTRDRFESEFERIFGESYPDAWAVFTSEPRCGYELPWCAATATRSPLVREGEVDCEDPETLGFSSDIPQYLPMVVLGYEQLGDATVQIRIDNAAAAVMSCEPCTAYWSDGFGSPFEESLMLQRDFPAGTYGIYLMSGLEGTPYLSLTE